MVYLLLGEGFEEVEALTPLDLLRRAGVEAAAVSLTDELTVRGGHGIAVRADMTLGQVDFGNLEMVVLPGGAGGVAAIANEPEALELVRRAWEAEKMVAAICAAPSLLVPLGILPGLRVVCHPSVEEAVQGAGGRIQPDLEVTHDRNLITGKAAGASIDFSLKLVAMMKGWEAAQQVRREIYYERREKSLT